MSTKTTEQNDFLAPTKVLSVKDLDVQRHDAQTEDKGTGDGDQPSETVLTWDWADGSDPDADKTLAAKIPDPVGPVDTLVLLIEPDGEALSPSDITIEGTNGDDVIIGGGLNESIHGFDGEDLIHGGDGNDIISAFDGSDSLYGDAGNDWLSTWNVDSNFQYGGTGDDRLLSYHSDDQFFGGIGNDEMFSHGGNNTMYGEAGNDEIVGGEDADLLFGGGGNDYLNGAEGQDTLSGGNDADVFGFYAVYMNDKDTVTDFVIGEDRIDVFDLHNIDLAKGETLGDAMTVLDVDGGADVMARTTLHGWEVFAHFENVDAAALQAAIDDGSIFYEYGDPGLASPIIGAQPFDFL